MKSAKTFLEFCNQFEKEIPHVQLGKRYFYDPEGMIEIARKLDAFSVGIYLGEQKQDFKPTSALIDLLAGEKKVVVNDESAWLFICGRDVLMRGALSEAQKGLVFVTDTEGNVLGYGRVKYDFNTQLKNKVYVKNLLDKGEYLRREK